MISARDVTMMAVVVAMVLLTVGPARAEIQVGSTIRITDNPAKQTNPDISGNLVVWEDYRNGNADIYGYNLSSSIEFPIAVGSRNETCPQITGSLVVWQDRSAGLRYCGKDLNTGQVFTAGSTGTFAGHSIVGRDVFYASDAGYPNHYRIYRYNVDSGTRTQISPEDGYDHMSPSAKDGYLAWTWSGNDAYIMDLSTSNLMKIACPPGDISELSVARHNVFYKMIGAPGAGLKYYDIAAGTTYAVPGTNDNSWHPRADGSIVIWTDCATIPAKRLMGCDVSSGQVFAIVDLPTGEILHTQSCTEIDGMRVLWTRTNADFSQMDVYVTELVPEPATMSLLALGGLALVARRRKRRK